MVALNAFPGDNAIPAEGLGEGGLLGVFMTAEGGGEVPSSEERIPPFGEAKMLLVVGIAGDPGTDRPVFDVLALLGVDNPGFEDED